MFGLFKKYKSVASLSIQFFLEHPLPVSVLLCNQ